MTFSSTNRGFPAGNPIANIIVVIVGSLAIAVSIVVGFVAFVVLASIVLVMAAVIGIRLWWLNRKLASAPQSSRKGHADIEGEFTVIEQRENGEHR